MDLSPGVEKLSINLVARNKVDDYHIQEAGPYNLTVCSWCSGWPGQGGGYGECERVHRCTMAL